MKQTINQLKFAAVLPLCSLAVFTSCSHDDSKYERLPYSVTDKERVSHAENILGVAIDQQQDWMLTTECNIQVTADADLDNISQVMVLDANPFEGDNYCLASASLTNGGSVTLTFRVPKAADVLYAACMTDKGQIVARPFVPGTDKTVSFAYSPAARKLSMRRSASRSYEPDYTSYYMKDFLTYLRLVRKTLPEGADNRGVMGKHNYTNTVRVRKNPYAIHELPLAYMGGNSGAETDLAYEWFPQGQEFGMGSFLIHDSYPAGWNVYTYDASVREYELQGHELICRNADEDESKVFSVGDIVQFHVAKNGELLPDGDDERVKVIMINQYVVVCCEDGDDWDYNDRMYWMPYGVERLETDIVDPVPTKPEVWTYVWEDQDFGDYDMNDCVIEVQENVANADNLDVTLVALGAMHDIWLGFDNKAAVTYKDYKAVFGQELHEVLGVARGTMVNTGGATAKPVTVTVAKPEGFDFQTCSFILGAMVEDSKKGMYENDYYYIKIASKGQDPHGIVIPGKWQWPTERTCIKDAYPEFITWSADHTKALDWYKHPVAAKVVSRQ